MKGGVPIADEGTLAQVIAKRKKRVISRESLKLLLIRMIYLTVIAYLIFTYGFLITQCHGQGMFPSMKDGDLCVVFRKETQLLLDQPYKKDDIIAYRQNGQRDFGRVVAVAGDIVMLDESGQLSVNGVTENQEIVFPTYAKAGIEYPLRVPEGCVFVLGDYRTHTKDSRDLGPIFQKDVEGKVITILRRRGL